MSSNMIPQTTTNAPATMPATATQAPGFAIARQTVAPSDMPRPLTLAAKRAQSSHRAKRLLAEGYRFVPADPDARARPSRYHCHRPAGGAYLLDTDALTCTCPRYTEIGTCSHLLCLLDIDALGCRPEFVAGGCPHCGGPTVRNTYHVGGLAAVTLTQCYRNLAAAGTSPCPHGWSVGEEAAR